MITDRHQMVADWHRAMRKALGQRRPGGWEDPQTRMRRARLFMEEAIETVEAIVGGALARQLLVEFGSRMNLHSKPSLVDYIDGRCDTEWVLLGSDDEFLIDSSPFWAEIGRSNWTKVEGALIDERGKFQKGPNFSPPRIAEMVAAGVGLLPIPEEDE